MTSVATSTNLAVLITLFYEFSQKYKGSEDLPTLVTHLPSADGPNPGRPGVEVSLLQPVREFVSRDSKQFRTQLVDISFALAQPAAVPASSEQKRLLECVSSVVEAIHAGSLMIDDIQDADDMRRGRSAVHRLIGVPRTINAANWLYFWVTELLQTQVSDAAVELEIYRLFHKTMMRAHEGQALDLGCDMTQHSQAEVLEIATTAIELKTGELTRMCTEVGAIVAKAEPARRKVLAEFGHRFGVALQMFNDLGEFLNKGTIPTRPKTLTKPSWVWAVAAKQLSAEGFSDFQKIMAQTECALPLNDAFFSEIINEAKRLATYEFEKCIDDVSILIEVDSQETIRSSIDQLIKKVMCAYV